MKENPAWANRALKEHWSELKATQLPLPIGKSGGKFEELGCGHYGCVLETPDSDIVFKLTSDPTEAEFIQLASPFGWPDGIVRYHAIVPLDFTFRRRQVYAIWREAAFNVGELYPTKLWSKAREGDYEARSQREFETYLLAFKDHAARFRDTLKRSKDPGALFAESKELEQWARDQISYEDAIGRPVGYGERAFPYNVVGPKGAERLAVSWRACEIIAETMANTYLADSVGQAFEFYMERGFLLADVHAGNIGQVKRDDGDWEPWVITDPGHVVALEKTPLS